MSSKNPGATALRGREASERALIDAAILLFAENGVRGVSVRAIAKHANVNHGLVHHYFGSKSGLVTAVLDVLAQRLATFAARSDGRGLVEDQEQTRIHVRVLAYAILEGNITEYQTSFPIVERFAAVAYDFFGLDETTARLRAVQAAAMIFGWMILEPWLLAAGGFDPGVADELRVRLAEGIARLAASDAPQPPVSTPPMPPT